MTNKKMERKNDEMEGKRRDWEEKKIMKKGKKRIERIGKERT